MKDYSLHRNPKTGAIHLHGYNEITGRDVVICRDVPADLRTLIVAGVSARKGTIKDETGRYLVGPLDKLLETTEGGPI